ncbi:MAG: hypothetical protein AAF652_13070 [Cyanobacteria bacterium P01_C01_bin.72]
MQSQSGELESKKVLAISNRPSAKNTESIEPLSRLVVRDGLLLNADRWREAHQYHRQRQNLHYSSLHQGGIVSGLGVKEIAPPANVPAQYRQEKRWLQVQPGMAIDNRGNPIIVTEAIDLRLAADAQSTPLVYLVISYVDPERLETIRETEFVREMFRIEEKSSPPNQEEIELCRLKLQAPIREISNPDNPLFPQANQIDLLGRPTATLKPPKNVRVAQLANNSPTDFNWQHLFRSVAALYPALGCSGGVKTIDLNAESALDWDLLWLTQKQLYNLQPENLKHLSNHLTKGRTVVIEVSSQETAIAELTAVKNRLQSALVDAKLLKEFPDIPQQIETELQACEARLSEQIKDITTEINNVFPQLRSQSQDTATSIDRDLQDISDRVEDLTTEIDELTTVNSETIGINHPLRNQPFLFGQFPIIDEQAIQIFTWGGIILVIGDLSSAWGLNQNHSRSRETIRTAQEMGINLLHFAWRKRHLSELME